MLRFACPKCRAPQAVDEGQAGKAHACAVCGQVLRVPTPVGAARAAPGPESFAPSQAPGSLSGGSRVIDGRAAVVWPCPYCGHGINTPAENVGKSVQCPACYQSVPVPASPAGTPPTPCAPPSGVAPGVRVRRFPPGRVLALMAAVLVVTGAAAALLVWQPWSSRPQVGIDDSLRFLPEGSEYVLTVDVQGLITSAAYQRFGVALFQGGGVNLRRAEQQMREVTGLGWSDCRRITLGGKWNEEDFVVVVQTTDPARARDLLARASVGGLFEREQVGGHPMYRAAGVGDDVGPVAFCVPGPTTLLVGPPEAVRSVLRRDNQPPALSPGLREALKQADFTRTLAAVVGQMPRLPRTEVLPVRNGLTLRPETWLAKIREAVLQVSVTSSVEVKLLLRCADVHKAQEIKGALKALPALAKAAPRHPPQLDRVLHSLQITSDGDLVSATVTVDADTLAEICLGF